MEHNWSGIIVIGIPNKAAAIEAHDNPDMLAKHKVNVVSFGCYDCGMNYEEAQNKPCPGDTFNERLAENLSKYNKGSKK
jgi:hypothetical protein